MLRRRALLYKNEEITGFVDLGLPSGRKWAIGNIISDGNEGYKIGEETDYGAYFSWGNIVPHFSSSGSFDDGYNWGPNVSKEPYVSSPGASVSNNIQSNDAEHDAARALLGAPWHLPTKEDFQELYDNTDRQYVINNNVRGYKFMKKTDHLVYVFLPMAGYGGNASINNRGARLYYWSSSWISGTYAYCMFSQSSSSVSPQYQSWSRHYGSSVRAVI